MAQNTPTFWPAELQQVGEAILVAVGTPSDLASMVVQSLVGANLAGHDSHGIMRLMTYVEAVRSGQVRPEARPLISSQYQATAVVDGAWGWGQPAAQLAQTTAIALARDYGIGAATVHHCNHIGRLGEYVEAISRENMIGMVLCNAGPVVTPYGGRDRRLGTNPFSWAAPTGSSDQPIMLDFATSAVAEGKLQVAMAKDQEIPSGYIVNHEGRTTTTPSDFYAGGALLPFGGHKGYAMSVMVEIMAGVLSGTGPACLPEYNNSYGTLIVAFNIAAFRPLGDFLEQTERFTTAIRETRPAPGFEKVMLPGEPEIEARHQRLESGILVPEQTWMEICRLASDLGVTIDLQGRG